MASILPRFYSRVCKWSFGQGKGFLSSVAAKPQIITSVEDSPTLKDDMQNDPLKHPDYFGVQELFTVKNLFDSRVHWGHTEGTLNPHMKQYIFGSRLGQLIFDLDKTAIHMRQALNFAAHIAYRKGIILFISRNPQFTYLVESTAKECEEYAHARLWITGTFTNNSNLFGGVTRLPDLVIFINTLDTVLESHPAITEAAKLLIPTIGIVDSNCDPTLVTYPVPGNDDSPPSLQLYCNLFKQAILKGKTAAIQNIS